VGTTYQALRCNLARSQSVSLKRVVTAVAVLTLSCQASVSGDASAHVRHEAEETPDFDKPISAEELAPKPAAAAPIVETTLLGARHDLSLVVEHANAACACIKVGLGSAQSAAFQWQAAPPHLREDTQVAFALSSESMTCNGEEKGSSGASYWGYRISGNDVIVFVEGARVGRPRTSAAIIPKPVGAGLVYVAPATKKLPYGRSLDARDTRCKVGGMPSKRTIPFSAGELGDAATPDQNAAPTVDAVE
jgi:hypothetical protein